MIIDLYTLSHPRIVDREITVIFVDSRLDIPSMKFLIHEARYGGRHNGISGKTTHRLRAVKIQELYRHLSDMGKKWHEAIEPDIVAIRNAMLCWDINENTAYDKYEYKPISHDAMNQKLSTWFKFYQYMSKIGEEHMMVMDTKKIPIKHYGKLLSHLDSRHDYVGTRSADIWNIRVRPDPMRKMYHAITRSEFEKFFHELHEIDIVYALIALFMVETGLRIDAVLSIEATAYKSYFTYLNQGKSMNETIEHVYVDKGGQKKKTEIPIRLLERLQEKYGSRIYPRRRRKNNSESKKLFLKQSGKEVKYMDVLRAFRTASDRLGHEIRITPHWMRHTFATWFILDHVNREKSVAINDFAYYHALLNHRLGHTSMDTTRRYMVTAMGLLSRGIYRGPIVSSISFQKNKKLEELIKMEAQQDLGDQYDVEAFDAFSYAKNKGIIVSE